MAKKNYVEVEVQVDVETVLDELDTSDIIEYLDKISILDDVLDYIGKDECIKYFEIVEAEKE